jgi:adenylate cyclase
MSFQPNGELVPVGGGDRIPLVRETLSIGRRESCDIPLRYANVSAIHAVLTFQDGYWRIRDMNSTNGIKVNGQRVVEKLLHPKDIISIAKRRYTIQYELPTNRRAMEEVEEDILSRSLLERAGLEKPKNRHGRGKSFDPADFLLGDDED